MAYILTSTKLCQSIIWRKNTASRNPLVTWHYNHRRKLCDSIIGFGTHFWRHPSSLTPTSYKKKKTLHLIVIPSNEYGFEPNSLYRYVHRRTTYSSRTLPIQIIFSNITKTHIHIRYTFLSASFDESMSSSFFFILIYDAPFIVIDCYVTAKSKHCR